MAEEFFGKLYRYKLLVRKSLANRLVSAYAKYIFGIFVNIGREIFDEISSRFANFSPPKFPMYGNSILSIFYELTVELCTMRSVKLAVKCQNLL